MNSRNISLDLLKITLALFIVLLHGQFLSEYNEKMSFLTVQGMFRVAVPVFFLINGYFFKHVIDLKLTKWMIRVFILYSVWMIIYSPLWFSTNIKSVILQFFVGYFHLWYINAMLLSGLALYLIRKMSSKNMFILALVLHLIGSTIQYLGNHHFFELEILDRIANWTLIHRNFLFFGLPFFIIGYLINKNDWHEKVSIKLSTVVILLASVLLLVESYANYYFTKEGIDNLFTLILLCPFIFIFAIKLNFSHNISSKYIALLSTAIFLVHPWIMIFLKTLNMFEPTALSLLTIAISFVISLLIIRLNTKFRFLL